MSGELLLALAYGASLILTGAIAYRVVKKDYTVKSRRDEESGSTPGSGSSDATIVILQPNHLGHKYRTPRVTEYRY